MLTVIRTLSLAVLPLVVTMSYALGSTPNLYIAQNQAGSADGSSCANARPLSFFKASGNWGSGGTQIGPGSTVHLCGVFTAPAGASGFLDFQAGGTPGTPITMVAEPGAVLQAPYWGANGAISAINVSNVVLDGRGQGIIRATANGTLLANQQPNCPDNFCTLAIYLLQCDNCAVKNWTISNIYVNVPPADESNAGEGSAGILFNGGNNAVISGNTLHDAKWCIVLGFVGGVTTQNARINGNTAYNCDHGVFVGSDDSGAILSGVYVYGNTIHDGANWDDLGDGNHHDGIHLSPSQLNTAINNSYVYNNHIYGDWGFNCNAFVYLAPSADPGYTMANANVFNNLLVNTSPANTCANGLIQDFGAQNALIANNTLIGSTQAAGQALILEEASPYAPIVKNNILVNLQNGIYVAQGNTFPVSDYNVFYNVANVAFVWGTACCTPLSDWQAQAGSPDPHSSSNNPNLNSSLVPQSGGSAIAAAVNLTGVGIAALDSDRTGMPRPAAGAWDVGAYTSGSVAPAPAAPPPVSVNLTPTALSMAPAMQQQFVANVTNSTAGASWSVTPQMGTLSPAGMYTSPSTITTQQQVSITATAQADSNARATAVVTLMPPPPPPITVTINPTSQSLGQSGQQQFTATVTGSTAGATWSLSPPTGTLSATGLYTAPATITSQQQVQVKAASVANPAISATATVTLTPPPPPSPPPTPSGPITVTVNPLFAKASSGRSVQFTANVQGSTAGVKWSLSPKVGTLSSTGLYTAPGAVTGKQTIHVKATVVGSSPLVSAVASVTIFP